jgi:hypothetical protein
MHRLRSTFGVTIVSAGLISVPAIAPPLPDVQVRAVRLTSVDTADSPLGDGAAFVLGGSGIPIPSQGYVDAADTLYLEPHGFTGAAQALFTPEGFYPVTGVKSLTVNASEAQGEQIIEHTVQSQIAGGHVDAANPVVFFGYSQSSAISSLVMPQLADEGVPSDDVHFVLVGDTSAPNGGLLERFDLPVGSNPQVPAFGITFGGATPSDLYPTDVYTLEYDGFADFPQYPIDPLSDLNAFLGFIFEHLAYLGLTPEQIAGAMPLPTSAADTLTNYSMIPVDDLPLLDPLRLIPVIGNPLADLLQPDLKVLVNLGYGSITDGWSQGDANVPTPFGFLPPLSVLEQVPQALVKGLQQGVTAAITELQNPDNYHISTQSILDQPFITPLVDSAFAIGDIDTKNPTLPELLAALTSLMGGATSGTTGTSLTDIINDLAGALSADYATLLPIADTATTLLTTVPEYDASLFVDQLQAGNLLDAIGDPIAANTALLPFALLIGAVDPILGALGTTLGDLMDLIPGS